MFTPGGAGVTIQSDTRAYMFLGGSPNRYSDASSDSSSFKPQGELLEIYENQAMDRQPDDLLGHYVDVFA